MKKYIVITADMNDADHTTKVSLIEDIEGWMTKEEIEQLFIKLAKVLKEHSPVGHNWPNYDWSDKTPYDLYVPEFLTGDDIETIGELGFIPRGQDGIHSITSIEILNVTENNKLL